MGLRDTFDHHPILRRLPPAVLIPSLMLVALFGLATYFVLSFFTWIILFALASTSFLVWWFAFKSGARPSSRLLVPFVYLFFALMVNFLECYLTGFSFAISYLLRIVLTERTFIVFAGFLFPIFFALTAMGLIRKNYFAAFLATFSFVVLGFGSALHFALPFLASALDVEQQQIIEINYPLWLAGKHYFPGLITAIFPVLAALRGMMVLMDYRRNPIQAPTDFTTSLVAPLRK